MFNRLERDMVHDLSAWRREVIDLFNTMHEAALRFQQAKSGSMLPLASPANVTEMRINLTGYIAEEWDELQDVPLPGEFMQISGPVRWYDAADQEDVPTPHLLLDDRHIYGNYVDWKILPNFDAMLPPTPQEGQIKPGTDIPFFGLHLVIEDPTFTDANNNLIRIYADEIYVPIHYERARFVIYGNY